MARKVGSIIGKVKETGLFQESNGDNLFLKALVEIDINFKLPFQASPSLLLLPSWLISFIGGNIQFSPIPPLNRRLTPISGHRHKFRSATILLRYCYSIFPAINVKIEAPNLGLEIWGSHLMSGAGYTS
ncbi:uncharacterized protein G2W53_007178 [Senna tora]|uniref:Uncharacterized protein n=1 Tax=Senna tora TaxID=362788 RepID=A0A835CEQ0_9FABA|nr:uncharacterized protein G2W53_007178 [Senna tora]